MLHNLLGGTSETSRKKLVSETKLSLICLQGVAVMGLAKSSIWNERKRGREGKPGNWWQCMPTTIQSPVMIKISLVERKLPLITGMDKRQYSDTCQKSGSILFPSNSRMPNGNILCRRRWTAVIRIGGDYAWNVSHSFKKNDKSLIDIGNPNQNHNVSNKST